MTDKGKQTIPAARLAGSLRNSMPRGERLRDELASISSKVKELESVTSSLPYVNADGSSECPWAESLYARKEELEGKVRGDIHHLADYLMQLDADLLRCLERLKKIQADYAKLNHQTPQHHYAEAVRREQDQCQHVQDDRDAVSVVLTRAKAVLAMSRRRKYPGKKPQQQFPMPTGTPGVVTASPQGPSSAPVGGGVDSEIGGLMSLRLPRPGGSHTGA